MEPSLATLLLLIVGAVAVVGLVAAITAPPSILVGESQWEVISAFHGMGATVFLLGSTIAVYLSWRLYTGQLGAFKDLKWLTAFSTFMAGGAGSQAGSSASASCRSFRTKCFQSLPIRPI